MNVIIQPGSAGGALHIGSGVVIPDPAEPEPKRRAPGWAIGTIWATGKGQQGRAISRPPSARRVQRLHEAVQHALDFGNSFIERHLGIT